MPSDVRIFDGAAWVSLQGPQGPAGPSVVSADVGNLAKLGTDNRVLVAQADLDARYVNVTGDTMTGPLLAGAGRSLFTANNEAYSIGVRRTAAGGYVYFGATDATATPGLQLSAAGGGSVLTISNTGNITNTGTSHSFAAGSIPRSAVAGVAEADLDTRYVNISGDAMTGTLITNASGAGQGVEFRANGNNGAGAQFVAARFDTSASGPFFQMHKGRGTSTAPTGVVNGDFLGTMAFVTRASTGPITSAQISVAATGTTTATNTPVAMLFAVSDGATAPATVLTVRPSAASVTGTLSVTGNITSSGTAHNFAANSITASAIMGLPTAATTAPLDLSSGIASAGSATAYARADHQHKLPTYSQLGPLPLAAFGQAGAVKAGTGLTLDVDGTLSVTATGGLTQTDADTRYVNVTGDTVTGDLIVNGKLGVGTTPVSGFHVKTSTILLDGFVSNQGSRATAPVGYGGLGGPGSEVGVVISDTRSTIGACIAFYAQTNGTVLNPAIPEPGDFAFRSDGPAPSLLGGDLTVTGNLIGERPFLALTGSRSLLLADRSANIANVSTGATPVTITLPTNAVAAFPIGSTLDILDLSATSATIVQAATGVSLTWNGTITNSGAVVAGGLAASLQLPGPIGRITVIKTGTDSWVAVA